VVVRMWSEWLNMYRNYYGQYLVENERVGTWRIETNYELGKLTICKNIINYIKAQRLS
jgi:hypothetical protein